MKKKREGLRFSAIMLLSRRIASPWGLNPWVLKHASETPARSRGSALSMGETKTAIITDHCIFHIQMKRTAPLLKNINAIREATSSFMDCQMAMGGWENHIWPTIGLWDVLR
jgi:hypothetical protein